jgi:hypothetical protein
MKAKEVLILLLLLAVYVLFPSGNPSTDAWYYAASVKYGTDLFLPHHLFYNAFLYSLFQGLSFIGLHPDALAFMQFMNAVFAAICLLLLRFILAEMKLAANQLHWLLFFFGSTFVFIRFATENETYLLPLLFSLWGTLFILKKKSNTHVMMAGFFAALACLFHQLHVFWWLAILVTLVMKYKKRKQILLFVLPALIVPVAYYLIHIHLHHEYSLNSLLQFVFYEYVQGVSTSFSLDYLKLALINFIRSFIQLHGYMIVLVKGNAWYVVPAICSLIFVGIAFLSKPLMVKREKVNKSSFVLFVLAFSLHTLFAVYSYGNAEFMIMLPLLLMLIVLVVYNLSTRFIAFMALALFSWNFFYAVFPYHYQNLNKDDFIMKKLEEQEGHFILQHSQRIENAYYYTNGVYPEHVWRSPFSYEERGKDLEELHHRINQSIHDRVKVYTDCLNDVPLDRSYMLSESINNAFFKDFQISKTDSSFNQGRYYYLYRVDILY